MAVCVEFRNDQLIHVVEQVLSGDQEFSCAVGVRVRANARCDQQVEQCCLLKPILSSVLAVECEKSIDLLGDKCQHFSRELLGKLLDKLHALSASCLAV